MGAERLGQLLLVLRGRLEAMSAHARAATYDGVAAATLKSATHKSQGSASSLGLMGLAAALRDLEDAIDTAPPGEDRLPNTIMAALGALEIAQSGASVAMASRYPTLACDHADGEVGALNR